MFASAIRGSHLYSLPQYLGIAALPVPVVRLSQRGRSECSYAESCIRTSEKLPCRKLSE